MKTLYLAFLLASVSLWSLPGIALAEQVNTADLNGDGTVDLADIAIIASCWLNICSCDGLQCGDDGCGGSCGACGANSICDNGICIALCDHVGFEPLGGESASHDGDNLIYQADSSTTVPLDYLILQIHQASGGPTTPGTYSLPDLNISLLTYYNCESGCEKTFFATSGTLEIYEIGTIGDTFTASLFDVDLIEVTINYDTWEMIPVPGGEDWCISQYHFDVPIEN